MGKKKRKALILSGLLLLVILIQLWLFTSGGNERLLTTKTYAIARDPNWFPFDFLGKESQLAAFSDDLLVAIGREEKMSIKIYTASPTSLFHELNNHSYDGVLSPVSPREVMIDSYLVSNPYFRFGPVLVVRRTSPITSIAQLHGGFVGVLRGATRVFEIPGVDLTYVTYDNIILALQNLAQGSLDGVIVNAAAAYAYTRSLFSDTLHVTTAPLTEDGLRLFALKNEAGQKLIEKFNTGLATLHENGEYEKLLKNWDLQDPEHIIARPPH